MLKNSGYADNYVNYCQSVWGPELSPITLFASSESSSCKVRHEVGKASRSVFCLKVAPTVRSAGWGMSKCNQL
jgi:hypothetical protein